MKWAGLPRNWGNLGAVYPYLDTLNKKLAMPLPLREVEGIAKSVVNISSKNLASGQTQAQFSRIQAAKGRKGGRISGAKRYQGSKEQTRPWAAEGVSRRTYYRHRGAVQESTEQARPWAAEGISRATWFRRKRRETNMALEA